MELVGGGDPPIVGQPLQPQLDVGHHLGIKKLAELGLAEQLAQQGPIQREGRGPLLGDGRVVFVHERRDEVEGEGSGERARPIQCHLGDPDLAAADVGQQLLQGRDVEVVLEHLAIGLEDHGEGSVPAGDLEQTRRLPALEPQGRPRAGTPAGEEQGPGRGFAEPRGEERAVGDLFEHQRLDFFSVDE